MITADSITDEQIRELRKAIDRETGMRTGDVWARGREQMHDCMVALGVLSPVPRVKGGKRAARARCAEILNARNEAK